MEKHHKYFLSGISVIILPVVILVLLLLVSSFVFEKAFENGKSEDTIHIISEINSPDQDLITTIFSYSGGGAAGWSGLKVNIRKKTEKFDSNEYVFGASSGTEIKADWKNNHTLMIFYKSEDRIISLTQKKFSKDKTVKIYYDKTEF